MIINGIEYKLVEYPDTSAPCSNCVFFIRHLLKCDFPKDYTKECECKLGLLKGWKTKEYDKV